ncbi:MAG: G8 domain-containing protein [Aureispira sp.]
MNIQKSLTGHCTMLFFILMLSSIQISWGQATITSAAPSGTFPQGDFESPNITSGTFLYWSTANNSTFQASGYNFTGGTGIASNGSGFTGANPNAPQGTQVVFIQGSGSSITRTLNINNHNRSYRVMLKAALRNWGNQQKTIRVFMDNIMIGDFPLTSTNYEEKVSLPIVLPQGSHTLKIQGINPVSGDHTAFVDDVRLELTNNWHHASGFESPSLAAGTFMYWSTANNSTLQAAGYTFTGGSGITSNGSGFTGANPNTPEGQQVVFLQSPNTFITRTFNVAAIHNNKQHRVLMKAALRNMGNQQKHIRILIDNILVDEFPLSSINYKEKASLPLVLSQGTHTLKIQGINPQPGDHTAFIDDVRLEVLDDWNDAGTWQGGVVPGPNDRAIVASNSAIGMRDNVTVGSITVNGQLVVAQNSNLNLTCKYLLTDGMNGLFQIGQKLAPYTGNATITLNASRSQKNSTDLKVAYNTAMHSMGTKFVGAMHMSRIELHGAPKTSWTQLNANANTGATTIDVVAGENWKVGDKVVVASSRVNWQEAEERTITAISNLSGGAKRLTVAALQFPHKGVQKTYTGNGKTWNADLRAEVGMLTHNIKIQGNAASEGDNGFGAHTMIMMGAKAYVSNTELYRMGQKSEMGRYPFHWHLLANDGIGQYIENSSVHKSFNRAITIHGTHGTRVDKNVCYDHIGHGLFLEDGAEENNFIRENLVLHTRAPIPGEELTPSEDVTRFTEVQNRTPASFWITNPKNTFEGNVAAGTQGTGYWFAFPQRPMGQSAADGRLNGIRPHQNPLISFSNNKGHSCGTGFDIFDQLTSSHDIIRNAGWANNDLHLMENCQWYANGLALYSGIGGGGPSDNLIFRNNVFVENRSTIMFASYSIVDGSVFVARSGENLVNANYVVKAYLAYDGAGQVHNSHFVGWNHSKASVFGNIGAATKHPNHWFVGNTSDAGIPRITLPNYDITPSFNAGANDPDHPRMWSFVIRDVNGGISGKANTSIISSHPFMRDGNEYKAPNWTNVYRSDHKFVLSVAYYLGLSAPNFPNVTVTRTGNGASKESVFYIGDGSYKEHHQLPFIANQDFTYTYAYESLPSTRHVGMAMDDAAVGDYYLAVFKDFGTLGGLSIQSNQGGITPHNNLASLKGSASSGYLIQNGDLYIRSVATGKRQYFDIRWTSSTNYPNTVPDTDGDYMPDGKELEEGRNPFHAQDLAFEFNTANDLEGWTSSNVNGHSVGSNAMNGSGANNGDAMLINRAFNFNSDEVTTISIRMKSNQNNFGVHLFFGTNTAPGFSGSRLVAATYTGNGAWQTLTFNVSGHAAWNGVIKDIRIDPVTQVGRWFNVDYIRANAALPKSNTSITQNKEALVNLYPNPVKEVLTIQGIAPNVNFQIMDVNGRVVKAGAINGNTLNVQQLANGNYWILIEEKSYPFVKQ